MGDLLLPAFLAAAALLVVAGAPKVVDPAPLARAVRSAGIPLGARVVRGFAAAEVLVGLVALAAPGRATGGLLALMYAVFSGFVALALVRGGVLDSCGCFGKADTPPTRSHLAVTAGLALVGLTTLLDPPTRTWWAAGAAPVGASVLLAALLALLAWAVMAVLPTVTPAAVRSTQKG